MEARLKVGVVVDGLVGPRWVGSVLRAIRSGGDARIAAVSVANGRPPARAEAPLLYRLYERLDRSFFRPDDDPLAHEDLSVELDGVAANDGVAASKLDVVVDLRANPDPLRAELHATHGTWRFQFGDQRRYGPEVPLLRELIDHAAVCTLSLARLPERDADGYVAYSHHAAPDATSLAQTAGELRWKAPTLATRLLADLALHGRPDGAAAAPLAATVSGYPGAAEMVGYLARLAGVLASSKLQHHLMQEQWTVGIKTGSEAADDLLQVRLDDFLPLESPPGRYFADPFPIRVDGVDYVFFEDYSHADERGGIGYVALDREGRPGAPRMALQRDYHLSYPFLFSLDGAIFMVPETLQARRVELYRATRFPDEWSLERVLIDDIAAVDSTLLWHAGRIWLFASVEPERATGYDQLHIFHADGLAGPWRPHRANPVKADVRSSRPAGGFFRSGGRLIRPSQDGSSGYGGAIRFCEVMTLTEQRFAEKEVGRLEVAPGSGLRGVHTINANDRVAVVDWKRLRPAFLGARA